MKHAFFILYFHGILCHSQESGYSLENCVRKNTKVSNKSAWTENGKTDQ